VFSKFSANVVHRRLMATDELQQVTISDFQGSLRLPEDTVPTEVPRRLSPR